MLVLDTLTMEVNGEVILSQMWYPLFVKNNLQCLLVHILIEIRSKFTVHYLATTDDIKGILPELGA